MINFVKKRRIDSLSAKIFIAIFCGMTIVSVGLFYTVVGMQKDMLLKSVTSEGLTTASLLADNLKLAVYSDDRQAVSAIINSAMSQSDTRGITVFNSGLVPIVAASRGGGTSGIKLPGDETLTELASGKSKTIDDNPDYFIFLSPISAKQAASTDEILLEKETLGSARPFGYVAVAKAKTTFASEVSGITHHALGLTIVFLIVCVSVTFFLVYALTKPLRRLVRILRQRQPVFAQYGDIETLDATYLQLIKDLENAFVRIGSFNQELAEKVRERTEELERANEALEARVLERTKDLEETYRQLLHAERLSSAGKLVASIAHEINSPLCGLRMALTDLRQKCSLGGEDVKVVDLGLTECTRMAVLIDNLRLSTAPAAGKICKFALKEILDAIVLLNKRNFKKKDISFECIFEDENEELYGDKNQLFQVFMNLIQNSIDSIAENAGGHIRVSTHKIDGSITISVVDSGVGIQQENIAKIFDPFFTTKPEVKGTGLGLAIAMGIIKNHGGRIDVESVPAHGTRMVVVLPVSNF